MKEKKHKKEILQSLQDTLIKLFENTKPQLDEDLLNKKEQRLLKASKDDATEVLAEKHTLIKELHRTLHELAEVQKEKDELFQKLQRLSADYSNFQKRSVKQIAETITYEKEAILKTLLPALDNFEHTLQAAQNTDDFQILAKGVSMVHDQMLEILKSHSVKQIEAVGKPFDPALHQAMMKRSEPETEDNIVLEEFQRGYTINDRVIRPSKVVVNKIEQPQGKQTPPVEDTSQQNTEQDEGKKQNQEKNETE